MSASGERSKVVRVFSAGSSQQSQPSPLSEEAMICQFQQAMEQGLAPEALRAPIFVLWEITGACPQRCIYCYNRSPKSTRQISPRRLFELADDLIEEEVFNICLSGGEPMMRREYVDLMRYLRSSGITIGTVVSGAGMTDWAAERIARYASTLQVSLDGVSAEVHDRVRRREGSFDDALSAIKRFLALGKPVQVSMSATRLNIDDLPNVYELCAGLGVETVRTQKLVVAGRAIGNREEIVPTQAQYEKMLAFCSEMKAADPPIEYSDPTTHIRFGADHGISIMARFTSEGYVSVSPYLDTFFGDLTREEFSDVWSRTKRGWEHPVLQEFLSANVECRDEVIRVHSDECLFLYS